MALRFLGLGDSYTAGDGVRPNERWLYQLATSLRRDGWDIALPPEYIAESGWTTADVVAALTAQAPGGPFDIVTVLAGVNDQYDARPIDEFRACYGELLDLAVELAGGEARRTFAISLPDWGVTPFAAGQDRAEIALEIDAFNAEIRTLAKRRGIGFIDITQSTRNAGSALGMLTPDGRYPSRFQYGEWARVVRPGVEAALRGR